VSHQGKRHDRGRHPNQSRPEKNMPAENMRLFVFPKPRNSAAPGRIRVAPVAVDRRHRFLVRRRASSSAFFMLRHGCITCSRAQSGFCRSRLKSCRIRRARPAPSQRHFAASIFYHLFHIAQLSAHLA
jgi:hypothetical protein